MSMRLSLPSAKNPTDAVSGDENGNFALSVPASGCEAGESNGRTQSWDLPSFDAENTSSRPSGEIANESGSPIEGVFTSMRISGGVRLKYTTESAAKKITAKNKTAAIATKTLDL